MSTSVHNGGEPNHSEGSIDGIAGSRENDSDSRDERLSVDLDDNDVANTFHEVRLEDAVTEQEREEQEISGPQAVTVNKTSADLSSSVGVDNSVQMRKVPSANSVEKSPRDSQRLSGIVSPPVIASPTSTGSKLELFRTWSVNKIVCTKQLLSEKLGRASITIDADVQLQIEVTRDTQLKLDQMYQEAKALTDAVSQMVRCQEALHGSFRELAQKLPDLNAEFEFNADSMKMIFRKGDVLVGDLNFFASNVATLCGKTIEDTLLTIKQYEAARLEYDAHRTNFEIDLKNPARAEEAQRQFDSHREKFERLRADVLIKIKLLNENKLKVMRKQLYLFHCSVTTYFTELNSAMVDQQKRFKTVRSNTVETNFLSDEI